MLKLIIILNPVVLLTTIKFNSTNEKVKSSQRQQYKLIYIIFNDTLKNAKEDLQ